MNKNCLLLFIYLLSILIYHLLQLIWYFSHFCFHFVAVKAFDYLCQLFFYFCFTLKCFMRRNKRKTNRRTILRVTYVSYHPFRTPCLSITNTLSFHYEHPVFFLPSGVRNEKVVRNVNFPLFYLENYGSFQIRAQSLIFFTVQIQI
jgi:hypothetical protein